MKVSLLVCSTTWRTRYLVRLLNCLEPQVARFATEVELLISTDGGQKTIGRKRNELIAQASAPYLCFIDDDDRVAPTYLEDILAALTRTPDPDCVALEGIVTFDGEHPCRFVHSIAYRHWFDVDGVFYRPPNHLNVVRADLARQVAFPDISYGEDRDWSARLLPLLRTEAPVSRTLYYYEYRSRE